MYSGDFISGLDGTEPPLGTLQAIELPGHPDAHLQPYRPDHEPALRDLVIARLGNLAVPPPQRNPDEDKVTKAVTRLTGQEEFRSLPFVALEGAWKREASVVGYVGLQQSQEENRLHHARFRVLEGPEQDKCIQRAVHAALMYGHEKWDLHALTVGKPPWTPYQGYDPAMYDALASSMWAAPQALYDLAETEPMRRALLEGSRCFYSSPFGTIVSTQYREDGFRRALLENLQNAKERVIFSNSLMGLIDARLEQVLRTLQERGVAIEAYIANKGDTYATVSGAKYTPFDLHSAGVKLYYRNSEVMMPDVVIDQRKIGRLDTILNGEQHWKQIETERPLPIPIIQFMPLV